MRHYLGQIRRQAPFTPPTPCFTGLSFGTYTAWVLVSGENSITAGFNVSFTVTSYGISLDQTGTHTFTAATVGYGTQTAKGITITNTGAQATGALAVSLSGTNSTSFTLSTTSISSIAEGGIDIFTVAPKPGLAAGTYIATVKVSGNNSITASFNVIFTVNTVAVTDVTLNKSSLSLENGKSERLTAAVIPPTAANQAISWFTNDGGVATVSNGVINAVGEGTATISVITADGGKTASATVTVTAASGGIEGFLSTQSASPDPELLFAYIDSGLVKGIYRAGSIDNQVIAYQVYHHTGIANTATFSFETTIADTISQTIGNSVECGLGSSSTATVGIEAGVAGLKVKAEVSTKLEASIKKLESYQKTSTVTSSVSNKQAFTRSFDGTDPVGYYIYAAYTFVEYWVEVSINPDGEVVDRLVYHGIPSSIPMWTLMYSSTPPVVGGELVINGSKKLNTEFAVDTDEVKNKAVNPLQTDDFEWISDRPNFKVREDAGGLFGWGSEHTTQSDTIDLQDIGDFNYSDLQAFGWATAEITVDAAIRETADTWVDVAILKSNGVQIGDPEHFDPEGTKATNTWINSGIKFSRDIPLADIQDGKFTIRYSARGAGNNEYWVGIARVKVKFKYH